MNWSSRANKLYWRCLRKKDYPTEAQAVHAARTIRARSTRRKDQRMVAYKCDYCPGWHVGHLKADSKAWRERRETIE